MGLILDVGFFTIECYISYRIVGFTIVKYSLAHNMRQGKNSHCAVKKVMRRKRLTYELHDSYFRSMMITPAIPKIADVTHPNGQ